MLPFIIIAGWIASLIYIVIVYERRLSSVRNKTDRSGALEKARLARSAKKEARKERIIRYIAGRESATVEQVRQYLDVSESTIVRYLQELVKEGRITADEQEESTRYAISKKH